ncbi:MAG: hypothetical protein R3E66_00845 [bacterium]
MRGKYTKNEASKTIWYCTLVQRWIPGKGKRIELLVVTPDSVDSQPITGIDDIPLTVAKVMREAYNELDLFQRPVEIRTNDSRLAPDLTTHLRGVECEARYQAYWVRLEIAKRAMDTMYGLGGSTYLCDVAEQRRKAIGARDSDVA